MIDKGKQFAQFRKDAGYTQASLAQELNVTDKAVSKWERGICLPDTSLLPRLSMLLDIDIEYILAENGVLARGDKWFGEIRVSGINHSVDGKPLIHYLLMYFMLAGIKDVAIISEEWDYLETLDLSQYGLSISRTSLHMRNTMIVYDAFLLFGANLTRTINLCLNDRKSTYLSLHDNVIPIIFSHDGCVVNIEKYLRKCELKKLSRGMIYMPMNTETSRKDAQTFIRIYKAYNGVEISDLQEIAKNRRLNDT